MLDMHRIALVPIRERDGVLVDALQEGYVRGLFQCQIFPHLVKQLSIGINPSWNSHAALEVLRNLPSHVVDLLHFTCPHHFYTSNNCAFSVNYLLLRKQTKKSLKPLLSEGPFEAIHRVKVSLIHLLD